jgi:CheY-like chemotaxis protein
MSRRVAIVEDDEDIRSILADILRHESYETAESDGIGAIDVIASFRPSLVLLDLMMPEVDGFQVGEQMKSDPELAQIPIVILTARTDIAESAQRVGTPWYVSKPWNIDELLEMVETALAA